jgi:hypothetical protein
LEPRQLDRVAVDGVVRLGPLGVGVERIAVAGEGTDLEATGRDGRLEVITSGGCREERGRGAVGGAGVAAARPVSTS